MGRTALITAGAASAFVLALVLSALCSALLVHPAGAAVLPTSAAEPGGPPPVLPLPAGTSPEGQPSATTGAPPASVPTPVPIGPPSPDQVISTITRSALALVPPPVLSPVATAVAAAGSLTAPVRAAGPSPVPPAEPGSAGSPLGVVPPRSLPVPPPTGGLLGTGAGSAGSAGPRAGTVGSHRGGPVPPEPPSAPVVPLKGPGTAGSGNTLPPSAPGGSPFGVPPSPIPLLAASGAGGALVASTRARRLLLDLRSSPPV